MVVGSNFTFSGCIGKDVPVVLVDVYCRKATEYINSACIVHTPQLLGDIHMHTTYSHTT